MEKNCETCNGDRGTDCKTCIPLYKNHTANKPKPASTSTVLIPLVPTPTLKTLITMVGEEKALEVVKKAQDAHTRSELIKAGWKLPEEVTALCNEIIRQERISTHHQIAEWLEKWFEKEERLGDITFGGYASLRDYITKLKE